MLKFGMLSNAGQGRLSISSNGANYKVGFSKKNVELTKLCFSHMRIHREDGGYVPRFSQGTRRMGFVYDTIFANPVSAMYGLCRRP